MFCVKSKMLQVSSRPAAGQPKQGRKVLSAVPDVLMNQVLEFICPRSSQNVLNALVLAEKPRSIQRYHISLSPWQVEHQFSFSGLSGLDAANMAEMFKRDRTNWDFLFETENTEINGVLSWRFLITGKYRSQPWVHCSFILSLPSI